MSFYLPRETLTSSVTIDPGYTLHLLDASSGSVTATLLDASTSADHILIRVDSSAANTASVATFGSQTINGKSGPFALASFQSLTLTANNSNWVCREQLSEVGFAANGVIVDQVYGNDAVGSRNGLAFKTIAGGLAVAQANDVVRLRPGTYAETFTIPTGVKVIGEGPASQISLLNRVVDTDAITMGTSTLVFFCSVVMTGSVGSNVKLRGVLFPGTTAASSSCQFTVLSITSNFVGGSSSIPTYGVHSFGTGGVGTVSVLPNLLGTRIIVSSASNGEVRGVMCDTADHSMLIGLTNTNVSTTGSGKAFGLETNSSGIIVHCNGCVMNGTTADISQTQGIIGLNSTSLSHANTNSISFTPLISSTPLVFSAATLIPSTIQYFRPGGGSTSTSKLNMKLGAIAIVHKMNVTATTGPSGASDVFTLFKNGAATTLTVTLTSGSTSVSNGTVAVSFSPNDTLTTECNASATPCIDPIVTFTM